MTCNACFANPGQLCNLEGENVCSYCTAVDPGTKDLAIYIGREEEYHKFKYITAKTCSGCGAKLKYALVPCEGDGAIDVTAEFRVLQTANL